MNINSITSQNILLNEVEKSKRGATYNFGDDLLAKIKDSKDTYIPTSQETVMRSEAYSFFKNYASSAVNKGQEHNGTIKSVETNKYVIEEKSGNLHIYNKKSKEEFTWILSRDQIQKDEKTETKLLISDWGNGFFNMITVDDELEGALKESLGVDELSEKKLEGFTVNQDKNTGVKYVTANGYESRGGLIVMDDEAIKQLDKLAQEYLDKYPNLVKNYNEAWFYATFDVRGLAKQTPNGIMMIGPNCLSFKNKDGENGWAVIFDPKNWESVKVLFDSSSSVGTDVEEWNYWESLFKKLNIEAFLIEPKAYAASYENTGYEEYDKFMEFLFR